MISYRKRWHGSGAATKIVIEMFDDEARRYLDDNTCVNIDDDTICEVCEADIFICALRKNLK